MFFAVGDQMVAQGAAMNFVLEFPEQIDQPFVNHACQARTRPAR